jgi:2-deoxy-D-gluconate 3-dehydrogenase
VVGPSDLARQALAELVMAGLVRRHQSFKNGARKTWMRRTIRPGLTGRGDFPMTSTPFDLTGRVAIVNGGNGGIGSAWRGLATPARRSPSSAQRGEIGTAVASCKSVASGDRRAADVTDKAAVAHGRARASELGRIDILVNNAGINIRKPPHC